MKPPAYYNEFDPYAAQWLRNLIAAGHIAPGDVDERSIEDVKPEDLNGYAQCHFFAGIGVWSFALRLARWPDTRRVWTASCPCQPFSTIGEGAGFADERHLWPAFYHLVEFHRPAKVFGEQVASEDADPWIELVSSDMEALGYAFGAVPFPAASVGAPHIRDRIYWFGTSGMGDADDAGLEGYGRGHQAASGRHAAIRPVAQASEPCEFCGYGFDHEALGRYGCPNCGGEPVEAGPTNGYWSDADWLACRDGKWRPVEPGTFPLAHAPAERVGRLRAYGNAINAEQAKIFIEIAQQYRP